MISKLKYILFSIFNFGKMVNAFLDTETTHPHEIYYECPKCSTYLDNDPKTFYCSTCGQKLLWPETFPSDKDHDKEVLNNILNKINNMTSDDWRELAEKTKDKR